MLIRFGDVFFSAKHVVFARRYRGLHPETRERLEAHVEDLDAHQETLLDLRIEGLPDMLTLREPLSVVVGDLLDRLAYAPVLPILPE